MRFQGFALLTACVLLTATTALAGGVGGYFDYASSPDGEVDNYMGHDGLKYERESWGVGLVYDTAVAKDSLLNYRVSVGYQRVVDQDFDNSVINGVRSKGDGLAIENVLGFGLVRNSTLRFWAGPAVRLTFDFLSWDTGTAHDDDVFEFGVGIGPSIGANVHAGDGVSFGLALGYQYMFVDGERDLPGKNEKYTAEEQLVSVRATVFFRSLADAFEK